MPRIIKKKEKKIKAWAVLYFEERRKPYIENADALIEPECPAQMQTDSMAIYKRKNDARMHCPKNPVYGEYKLIPIQITFKNK